MGEKSLEKHRMGKMVIDKFKVGDTVSLKNYRDDVTSKLDGHDIIINGDFVIDDIIRIPSKRFICLDNPEMTMIRDIDLSKHIEENG